MILSIFHLYLKNKISEQWLWLTHRNTEKLSNGHIHVSVCVYIIYIEMYIETHSVAFSLIVTLVDKQELEVLILIHGNILLELYKP